MSATLSVPEAQLIASWLGAIFWAFFLVTFARCLKALLLNEWGTGFRQASSINWGMVAVSLSFFVFGTFDLLLAFYENARAFVVVKGGPDAVFFQLSNWVNVAKGFCVVMQTLIGDGVFIYRLWVVYNRSWKVLPIPVLLWLGTAASGGGVLFGEITTVEGTVGSTNIKNFIIALWTCSIAMNLLGTGLLVYRITRVDRYNLENGVRSIGSYLPSSHMMERRTRLQRLVFIFIESALLYTTMAFITFVTVLVNNSTASYPTSAIELQIVGIAFNLIIIRVADRGESDQSIYTVQYQSESSPQEMEKSVNSASDHA